MDNLGKAIYMACFALLFIFAASISLYLYGTLDTYLDEATSSNNISYRTEGVSNNNLYGFKRGITKGEIYITLYNMEQMHIDTLKVNSSSITSEDVYNRGTKYTQFLNALKIIPENKDFTYSCVATETGTTVTYSYK